MVSLLPKSTEKKGKVGWPQGSVVAIAVNYDIFLL